MTLTDLLAALTADLNPEECWLWTRAKTSAGYGQARWQNKTCYTHRLAWTFAHGSIPAGMHVLHNCPDGDNPSCFNPAHLWLGTNNDNIQDKVRKGRTPKGAQTGPCLHPERMKRGEQRRDSKLTDEAVREIRAVWGVMASGCQLARDFGVNQMTIWSIVNRRSWRHVRSEHDAD